MKPRHAPSSASCRREQMRVRLAKLEALRRAASTRIRVGVPRTHSLAEVRAAHPDLPPDDAHRRPGQRRRPGGALPRPRRGAASPRCRDWSRLDLQVDCSRDRRRRRSAADRRPRRPRGCQRRRRYEPARRAVGAAPTSGSCRQVPAAAAGQAPRPDRPGGPGPAAATST